ncbi:MAG: inositol monophosphatase family protein [Sulfurospirillaceae bacterium]|nr:inositol monophosphatase family protein [Sulfurospirillaceae bacterium]
MKNFIESAIQANQEIMELLNSTKLAVLSKTISIGEGGDMSRYVDIAAENIFIKHLNNFGNIYSEECGFIDNKSDFEIIIDPIDGSNNLIANFPYFGTSAVLKYKEKCIAAIIVNLANGDIFVKDSTKFQKANLKNLQFVDIIKNPYSTIGIFEKVYSSKNLFQKLEDNNIKYRSPGAIALSLAYAHEVDFVLFEGKTRIFDVEGGIYMCEDIHILKNEELMFISKDKETFDKMTRLF